jgi:hypothetical protein
MSPLKGPMAFWKDNNGERIPKGVLVSRATSISEQFVISIGMYGFA